MDMKKLVAAIVVSYAVLMALGYLIHNIWLMPDYQHYAYVWRTLDAMAKKRWVMWVSQLIFTVVFAWIYTRGVENKPWAGQGIRYGIAMTLLVAVPTACTEYVVYPIPYKLAVKWMIAGAVQLIAMGLVVAGIYRKPAS